MNYRFKTGDHIRVGLVPGSRWQGMHGTIHEVVVRHESESQHEYAVSFDGDVRWFMAEHLIRAVHPRLIRFFRNEVLERWKLDPDRTALLNGCRDQLVELLRDHYDFTIRRAEAEVDEFYCAFEKTIEQATQVRPHLTRTNIDRPEAQTAA